MTTQKNVTIIDRALHLIWILKFQLENCVLCMMEVIKGVWILILIGFLGWFFLKFKGLIIIEK